MVRCAAPVPLPGHDVIELLPETSQQNRTDECVDGVVSYAAVVAIRVRAGEAARVNGFSATAWTFGLMIGDDIALFDNLQTHLIATHVAVMGRCGLPLALFERLPVLVKSFLPAMEMRPDEYNDDDQQNNVG
jgi:hypothetical protein